MRALGSLVVVAAAVLLPQQAFANATTAASSSNGHGEHRSGGRLRSAAQKTKHVAHHAKHLATSTAHHISKDFKHLKYGIAKAAKKTKHAGRHVVSAAAHTSSSRHMFMFAANAAAYSTIAGAAIASFAPLPGVEEKIPTENFRVLREMRFLDKNLVFWFFFGYLIMWLALINNNNLFNQFNFRFQYFQWNVVSHQVIVHFFFNCLASLYLVKTFAFDIFVGK